MILNRERLTLMQVGGVTLQALNQMELQMMKMLDHRMLVGMDAARYYLKVWWCWYADVALLSSRRPSPQHLFLSGACCASNRCTLGQFLF